MARIFLTEDLLRLVKVRAGLPNTQASGSADADLLDFLNTELLFELVPHIQKLREEYFAVTTGITLVGNQDRYRIPERSIGQKLRRMEWVDSLTSPTRRDTLTCVNPDDASLYEASNRITRPQAFYIEGNYFVMLPNLSDTPDGAVEATILFRPGELVTSADYRKITVVDAANKKITVDSAAPSAWTTSDKVDVHSGQSGAEIRTWSNQIAAIDGTRLILTLTDEIAGATIGTEAVAVGDYVALEEKAAAPMFLPVEAQMVLAQGAVCRALEAHGDDSDLKMHRGEYDRLLRRLETMLNSRIEGQAKKVINNNTLWRSNRRRWRR